MKKPKADVAEKRVKTSLSLPEHLWDAAKRRALDERTEFQVIVARALEAYLKKGGSLRANIRETGDPLEFSVQGGEAKRA